MKALFEAAVLGHVSDDLDVEALVYHRLAPLVFSRLPDSSPLRAKLRPHVSAATARDLAQTAVLAELAARLDGLEVLVIKGAATGPLLYGDGALRPRQDIDVWVRGWPEAERLADLLTDLGFRRTLQLPGTRARHAIALTRRPAEQIDVHAVCARRVRVARALEFADAWRDRQALDGQLFTVSDEHAFFLGATHLGAHHAGQSPPLILLEDLRRLAARCTAEDWARLWDRVTCHHLASATRDSAQQLEAWARGALPTDFYRALLDAPADESDRFRSTIGAVLDDLDLLPPDDVLAYVAELAYPPSAYLERQFGVARPRPRPLLAGWRLLRGVVAQAATSRHNRGA